MKKFKTGIIGYGCRGEMMTESLCRYFADRVEIVAVCDVFADRAEKGADYVEKETGVRPAAFTDYRDVLAAAPDTVFIYASWRDHIRMSCDAMRAGIPVACEVGGGNSLEELWQLVETWEETKTPYTFLENCCYGRLEQLALHMRSLGLLGEIVHCEGGYHHDLRWEVAGGFDTHHYRLSEYTARNCHNYPSHDFLPLARLLDLNEGNRPLTLHSTASKAAGLNAYVKSRYPGDSRFDGVTFTQGDVITTVIKFAGGQTMTLTLDTTLPRAYSRGFTVHGTKGSVFEDTRSVFLEGEHEKDDFDWSRQWNNMEQYYEKYDSPIWQEYKTDPRGGHDGMDYLVTTAFLDSLEKGTPVPVNVYDAATTMAITVLSEISIMTGKTMEFPDFTKGGWVTRRERS